MAPTFFSDVLNSRTASPLGTPTASGAERVRTPPTNRSFPARRPLRVAALPPRRYSHPNPVTPGAEAPRRQGRRDAGERHERSPRTTPARIPPAHHRNRSSERARLCRDVDQVAQRGEAGQRLSFELADALACQVELVADRFERPRLALEPEAQLEDAPLALGERVECAAHTLAAERLLGFLERIRGVAVGEEVAELALVVGADRLVQRDGRVRRAERFLDVLHRQAGRLGELLLRRLATELDLEPARRARQLLLAFHDVHRNADRAGVVRDGTLYRLADPPGRIRRELVAPAPVELLDRAVQAERALLDQIEERDAEAAVALGDRHDEAKVGLDHAPLRTWVTALDLLREDDLVGSGEQLVSADVGQEELKAVGRAAGSSGRLGGGELLLLLALGICGGGGGRRGRHDLEPDLLELGGQLLDLLVVQIELHRERLELRRIEIAALLRAFDHHAGLIRLEQLVQLILRQGLLSPLGAAVEERQGAFSL